MLMRWLQTKNKKIKNTRKYNINIYVKAVLSSFEYADSIHSRLLSCVSSLQTYQIYCYKLFSWHRHWRLGVQRNGDSFLDLKISQNLKTNNISNWIGKVRYARIYIHCNMLRSFNKRPMDQSVHLTIILVSFYFEVFKNSFEILQNYKIL